MSEPHYSVHETVQRGKELYEREIRARINEEAERGKYLIIDVDTGEYELDDDSLAATHRALAKHPGAALYGMRVGFPALGKIGGSWGFRKP